jgi:hypothetical protein
VGVGAEHDAIAQQVDAARHAAGELVNPLQGPVVERHRPRHPRDREPMTDVVLGLLGRERVQVKAGDDALGELLELGPLEHRSQLGLADQDDLQQLPLVGLEVGQEAQLLEHLRREHLRLVDDEDVVLADGVGLQQEVVERVDVRLDRRRRHLGGSGRDVELVADRLQELHHRELRVEDVGDVAALGDLLEKAAADRRLACADLAREQDEAAAAADAVEQVGERLAVALAHVEVARVRRERERLLLEAEEPRVHGSGE